MQLCIEPATATATKEDDFFNYDVSDKEHPLFLQVYSKGKLVDKFEVLSLTKQPLKTGDEETIDVLTMGRVKKDETEQ